MTSIFIRKFNDDIRKSADRIVSNSYIEEFNIKTSQSLGTTQQLGSWGRPLSVQKVGPNESKNKRTQKTVCRTRFRYFAKPFGSEIIVSKKGRNSLMSRLKIAYHKNYFSGEAAFVQCSARLCNCTAVEESLCHDGRQSIQATRAAVQLRRCGQESAYG